jgi:hypothetical protein
LEIGKTKMELNKYIGKKVLFNLRPEFVEKNVNFFQNAARTHLMYGRVMGVDQVGVWVENPQWKTRPVGSNEDVIHKMRITHCMVEHYIDWDVSR